jgi:membrane-associated phospholipid phosphatase
VSDLGDLPVLVVGSVLAALVVVRRDRLRALACLVAPPAAALIVEWFLKPGVGRTYEEVLTFPSGSVAVVASLATAWALAVPRAARWPVVALGAAVVALMMVAVVSLRWHYASDALGGAVFGVGTVLLIDGGFHLLVPLIMDPGAAGRRSRIRA